MVTYERLSRRPHAAPSLIGMRLEAFDKLFNEFAVAHAQRLANLTVTKGKGSPRQRAVGAGGHRHPLCDCRLMTPFRLRAYTTDEVMPSKPAAITRWPKSRRQVYRHQRNEHSRAVHCGRPGESPYRRKALESLRRCGSLKDDRLESWRAGQMDSLTESTSHPLSRHKSTDFFAWYKRHTKQVQSE